jgi:signal peptide peptidase SppA
MNDFVSALLSEAWAMEPRYLSRFAAELDALPSEAEMRASGFAPPAATAPSAPALDVRDGVAHIPIRGAILKRESWMLDAFGVAYTSTERTRRALATANADPGVRAVMLDVDSPGGTVAGVVELAADIGASPKPVAAHIEDVGASAAYWLASQASSVSAGPSAAVGSIGIYTTVQDSSRAADAAGVKVHVVSSAPLKAAGVPGAPVSDEQLDDIRRSVDTFAAMFTGAVADGRGMSADAAAQVSTGQVWIGADAVRMGLADTIASPEQAHAAARDLAISSAVPTAPRAGAQEQEMEPKIPETKPGATVDADRFAKLEAELAESKARAAALEANAKAAEDREKEAVLAKYADRIAPTALAGFRDYAAKTTPDKLEAMLAGLSPVTRPTRMSEEKPPVDAAAQPGQKLEDAMAEQSLGKIMGQSPARVRDMQLVGEAVERVEYEKTIGEDGRVVMAARAVLKDGTVLDRAALRKRLGLRGALAALAFAVTSMLAGNVEAGALSAARATECKGAGSYSKAYLMKASTTIYSGGLVMLDSNGVALPAAASASNNGVVGVAQETKTSAASGSYWIGVTGGAICKLAGTTLAQTGVGDLVYAEDDQTVDETAASNEPIAGILVQYVGASVGWVLVGAEFSVRDWSSADPATLTGLLTLSAGVLVADDQNACFGDSSDACLQYDTAQTTDAFLLGVGADSEGVVICQKGDMAYDFAHADQTNPTLWIQSATQSATEWVSLAHDQTNGVLDVGAGVVSIPDGLTTVAATFTGDATLGGGAGALTFNAASSSIVTTDNSATGLVAGSTGSLSILTLDTRDAAPGVIVTGYLSASAGLITPALEADLVAGACTAGTWKVDNATTRELCRCNDAGSAYDCVSVTTANGPTN